MSQRQIDPDDEVLRFLREAFEDNYELLMLESGRGLSADGRQFAWNQVALYWRKLRDVAESVTDTEVNLMLPNQRTPQGRPYAIEGVVDIVREEGYTVMYDIKSYEAEYIRQNKEMYKQQLDVYAHIWQTLRGEPLDETAIIATQFPRKVAEALESGDERHLAYALAQWNPVIPMGLDAAHVDDTVAEFGDVADSIENSVFAPQSVERLNMREGGTQQRFATAVCRNCDARFSCASYRQWALSGSSRLDRALRQYFEDVGPDEELDAWRTANLEATPDVADLIEDLD